MPQNQAKQTCQSCGKKWSEHLGVQGTCHKVLQLQEAFKNLHGVCDDLMVEGEIVTYNNLSQIKAICDSVGFDVFTLEWREKNEDNR